MAISRRTLVLSAAGGAAGSRSAGTAGEDGTAWFDPAVRQLFLDDAGVV